MNAQPTSERVEHFMDAHLTYIKMIDRSSEPTRAAQRAQRRRPDRFAASEVVASAAPAGPLAWLRFRVTVWRRLLAGVA
jgi:hypothetical protein